MACGAPVVISRVSSLPEVVEDTAILVDPFSIESITEAIEKLLEDEELRKNLRKLGNKLVRRKFSWKRTAKMTLEVYEEV
jgi:glycosyltransferase involved in cell wall biosynthesis